MLKIAFVVNKMTFSDKKKINIKSWNVDSSQSRSSKKISVVRKGIYLDIKKNLSWSSKRSNALHVSFVSLFDVAAQDQKQCDEQR